MIMDTLLARFWSKVNKNGPFVDSKLGRCWLWTAGPKEGRYGVILMNGKGEGAHRVAFFLEHGRWPSPCGLHRCDVTRCVRPTHIFEGTQRDNMLDCHAKGRSNLASRVARAAALRRAKHFCVHGHEYTVANTYRRASGERGCKECRREAVRRWLQTRHGRKK